MKRRIYRTILGLATAAILLISGIFVYFYQHNYRRMMEEEIRTEAICTLAAFETKGNALEYLERLKQENTLRITLMDDQGKVLYDSDAVVSGMENHLDRPEVKQALLSGYGREIRMSDTLKEETYYYAVRMSDGRVLRLAKVVESNLEGLLRLLPQLLVVAILILFTGAVMARHLVCGIARKVNEIDLHNPIKDDYFEELLPLLNKIESQNMEIKEQMHDLVEQEEKLNTITNNMTEGLILLDRDSRIRYINESGKNMFDIHHTEMEGKHISFVNTSEQLRETIHRALKGELYRSALHLSEKQLQFSGNPVREKEMITGVVLFVLDVTADQKGEQMRKEFSANVSHELKTPLTSISGYAELMKNQLAAPEDMAAFSKKIYEEAQRLLVLVNDIIKISQLDEKDNRIRKEMVNLYELAGDIIRDLQAVADKNDIQIALCGNPVSLYAVKQMMYDLLYNLCENAVKYNKRQGKVSIQINEEDEYAIIQVKDTGIGIPMEYQERIFERFYRVDKSHSKQIGGTGLGLSIVKHVVEYQGGYIEIHSETGEGTDIIVHLQM